MTESKDLKDFSIADVISEELINLELKADTKEGAIRELTELLAKNGTISDKESFIADVLKREEEGMTGLGQGIAIPHGKSKSVTQTSIAVGRTRRPIEWESLDDNPVTLIILFSVKDIEANTMHIKLLQKVAVLLADDDFMEELHRVHTKTEMMTLLSGQP